MSVPVSGFSQSTAGFPCTIHGDAFVSRTIDCDDDFQRLDFTLSEARMRPRLRLALDLSAGASGGRRE